LEHGDVLIVVSTVGLMTNHKGKIEEIGLDRYYETMAFHADSNDHRYHDADVTMPVDFDSPWAISRIDADDEANAMHDNVVAEIVGKLGTARGVSVKQLVE
jgi:hypothetical protein